MDVIRAGTVLADRYRLDRLLGSGSMGHVWEGRDLRLDRPVAVKTIAASLLADPDDRRRAVARFRREAAAAAALDHVNVTTVHDAAVSDETCWLAMQYVPGATLGVLLGEQEGERLEPAAAAAVAAQVCAGLSAAHAAGLVHRDIKPANVMVRRDGVVKILDFGLVKLTADAGPPLTATGEHVGNLLYASPELLAGDPRVDGRSDLYSVGCLLHRMLAGAPPFPPGPPAVLARRHLAEEPPQLGDYGVHAPSGLQNLVRALLAKEPAARPGTAAEVYAALGPFLPPADPSAAAVRRFAPEDPRRPFVLPQAPHPA